MINNKRFSCNSSNMDLRCSNARGILHFGCLMCRLFLWMMGNRHNQ